MNDPAEWEAIHQSRHWGTYPDIHVVRQVKAFRAEWYRSDNDGTPVALDIGCGAGAHSFMLQQEGLSVVAIDVSETALKRLRGDDRRGSITVHQMDICSGTAPFSDRAKTVSQFDFILDNFTLTNIEQPPWDRILSWLKPGGWLVHASFSVGPKDSPKTWHHTSPGEEVERHEIWNEHGSHAFTVRRYIKPS